MTMSTLPGLWDLLHRQESQQGGELERLTEAFPV